MVDYDVSIQGLPKTSSFLIQPHRLVKLTFHHLCDGVLQGATKLGKEKLKPVEKETEICYISESCGGGIHTR